MKSIFLVVGSALICALMSCSTPSETKVATIENFTLTVPDNTEVRKKYSMEDFELYECSSAGVKILDLYVGNAPTFPKRQDSAAAPTEIALNGLKAREVQTRRENRVSREILVEVSGKDWPEFVHLWYDRLDSKNADVADRIIASIRQNHP
jgi:hypothetical protein